jgi:ubiquitin thioesterase protein OTUB1
MSDSNDTSNAEKVQQTQAQMEAIVKEIRESQALTSDLLDIEGLKAHYKAESSKYFELGVNALAKEYSKMRTIRGDGNCYYRAFLYSLCEKVLENEKERERVLKFGKNKSVS